MSDWNMDFRNFMTHAAERRRAGAILGSPPPVDGKTDRRASLTDDDEGGVVNDEAEHLRRLEQDPREGCTCENCSVMESEMESYCCRQSTQIADTVIGQSEKTCVTLVDIFRKKLKTKIY